MDVTGIRACFVLLALVIVDVISAAFDEKLYIFCENSLDWDDVDNSDNFYCNVD